MRHIAAAEQQRRERLAHRSGGSRRGRGGSIRGRGRGRGGLMMMKKSRTSEEDEGGGGGNSSDSGPDNLDLVRKYCLSFRSPLLSLLSLSSPFS